MADGPVPRRSDLWQAYEKIAAAKGHFVMRRVRHRREIYPVFRELFQRQETRGRMSAR